MPSVMSVFPLGNRCALLTNELKNVHGGHDVLGYRVNLQHP